MPRHPLRINPTSFQDLSVALGTSQKTLKILWQRPDAPARTRPWPELCKWAREASHQKDSPVEEGEPVTISAAELALKKKRGKKIDQDLEKGALEIAKLRGQMVLVADLLPELDAIGELYTSLETKDVREHPALYSDRSYAEIEALAIPRSSEKIDIFIAALGKVGKDSAAALAKTARLEKYGLDS